MPNDVALLVIDVQQGMFDAKPFEQARLLTKIKMLIDHARSSGAPVIYIQHNEAPESGPLCPGSPGFPVHPSIAPQAGETVVQKRHSDSFQNTNLQDMLMEKGIKRLVISGMQTEYCVDTTCREAYSRGYDVTLASDAHTTFDNEVLKADQIIKHHNVALRGFAKVKPAAGITFE
jgi:nicotinamidase-related amidase